MLDLISKFLPFKKSKKVFCYAPFLQLFVDFNNQVYTCPNCMLENPSLNCIGDLYVDNFEKIWKSKLAKQLRKNTKNNDQSNCVVPACANRTNFHMQVLMNYLRNNDISKKNNYPKIITFGEDVKGIPNCIMDTEELFEIEDEIRMKYFDVLKNADEVVFSYEFDSFSNNTTFSLMHEIVQRYPNIKFNFVSNGILLNKETFDSIGVTDKLSNILVYVNAATKETYDNFVKNGDFDVLKQNLNWLKFLKQEGKLSGLFLAFVVDENNFREMPQFVEFAKEYDAVAFFWLRDKGNYCKEDFNSPKYLINITHENYAEFMNILNSNDFNNKNSALANLLNKYVCRV